VNPTRFTIFTRLAIGMALVSLLAIGSAAAFLYVRFSALDSDFRESTLHTFARSLAQAAGTYSGSAAAIRSSVTARSISGSGGMYAIVTRSGQLVAGSDGVTDAIVPVEDVPEHYFSLPRGEEGVYGLSLRVDQLDPALFAQVAFPASHIVFDSVLEEFVGDIAWIWLPFLIVILAMNVVVARIALRPLSRAAQQVEVIGPESVSKRLTEGPMPPDVLVLVRAVNQALDRLQNGFKVLEAFVGDVAHELRTPLSVIKARLDTSGGTLATALKIDFERMERLVQQLLQRVRVGGIHFEPEDMVDLCEVSRDAARTLAPLAVRKARSIEVLAPERAIPVNGARDFIYRALCNLIENAIEYTAKGTTVTVVVAADPSITVIDRGPGFPKDRLDREKRRDGVLRSDRIDGVGLGLSIVERTMSAHRGCLRIFNPKGGGGSATMTFPKGK
jgi:signal transduction histidine kinase